jgi:hypothetical protein
MGVTITRWYEDVEGRNPRDMAYNRRQFQAMLADVQAGELDWLVVDSQDRFGTGDSIELGYYLHILRQNDCQLWSVDAGQGKDGLITTLDMGGVLNATVSGLQNAAALSEYGKRQVRGKRERAAKGEWQGGYIPFGFDVVAVNSTTGKENWRVCILRMIPLKGIWERVIVYPDGRQERCDGEDCFPKKQDWERLELAPSIIEGRVETVREIFKLFASGAWSVRGLCDRLNKRHVSPVTGEGWYCTRLTPMLKNPVYYTGMTVWGKNSHGKNSWYVGGEYLVPPRRKGRPLTGRRNVEADWVFPPAGTAIVKKDLWDEVQARLNGRPVFKKGLRDDGLWLAGLVVCDRCGQKMSGRAQDGLSYYCMTYSKFGKSNKTGCRLHRVSHDLLEKYVVEYLEELAPDVKALMETEGEAGLLAELSEQMGKRDDEFQAVFEQMRQYVERSGWTPHSNMERNGRTPDANSLQDVVSLYRANFAKQRADLEDELGQATAELRTLIANMNRIHASQTAAVEIQGQLIAEADQRVKELKDLLVPLDQRLDAAFEAVVTLDGAITQAEQAIQGDDAKRKALALRKVVSEVRLSFRHYSHKCRDKRSTSAAVERSSLCAVEVIPVQGNPVKYDARPHPLTVNTSPGPD